MLASVVVVGVLSIPYYLLLIIIIPCLFYEWVIEVPNQHQNTDNESDSSSSSESNTDSDTEIEDEKN